MRQSGEDESEAHVWHEFIDKETNHPYYHNYATAETSWERPHSRNVPTLVTPQQVRRTVRPKTDDLGMDDLKSLTQEHAAASKNDLRTGGDHDIADTDRSEDADIAVMANLPQKSGDQGTASRALKALQSEMEMLRRLKRQTEVVQDIKGLYKDEVGRSENLGLDWEVKAELAEVGELLETDYDLMREIFDDDYRRQLIGAYAKALLDTSPERPDEQLLIDDERYDALRQYYAPGVRDFIMDIEYEKFFMTDKDRKAFEDDYLRTLQPDSEFGFYRNSFEKYLVKYLPSHFVVPDNELRASPDFQNYRFHKVLEKHANNPDYLQLYYKPKAGAYLRINFFIILPILITFWFTHMAPVEHTIMYKPVKWLRGRIERGKRVWRRWIYH